MALDRQNISLSLGTGMDTKTDPKQVIAGKFLYLKNCTLQKTGKLSKRNGFGVIATATSGNALATYKNELIVMDGTNLKSLSKFDGTLYNKGQKVACSLAVKSIVSNSYQQKNADSAIHPSGFRVFSWDDSSGGVKYSIFDDVSGQAIVSSALVSATGSMSKVMRLGNYIVIFYIDNGTTLKYVSFLNSSPTAMLGPATVAVTANACYDVATINSVLYIAYSDLTSQTSLRSLSATLVLSGAFQVNKNVSRLGIFGDTSNNAWVIYNDSAGTTVGYFVVNSALSAATLAPTTIQTGLTFSNVSGYYSASSAVMVYEVVATDPSNNYVRRADATVLGAVSGAADLLRSVGLFAKPFTYSSARYFVVTHESGLQSTYFIIDSSGKVIAKIAPSSGGGLRTDRMLAEVNNDGTGVQFAYLIKDFVQSVSGNVVTQTGVNSARLAFGNSLVSVGVGDNLLVSGGVVTGYDGVSATEHDCHLYPEGMTATSVVGSGNVGTGQYQVCSVYEWTDHNGHIHRSAPSIPVIVKPSADKVYANGSVVSGTGGITFAGPADTLKSTYGSVTGPGLTGTVYVYNYRNEGQLSTSALATSTASGIYTFTPGFSFSGTTTIGSKVITLYEQFIYLRKVDCTAGSPTVYFYNTYGLRVGMRFEMYPSSGIFGAILSISGNYATMDTNAPTTFTNGSVSVDFHLPGTVTNGSNIITGVTNSSLISVGDKIASSGIPVRAATVTAISGTNVTVSIAATSTNSSGFSVFLLNEVPSVGQTLQQVVGTSAFSGPIKVTAADAVNRTVTVDQQAQVSATDLSFNSSEVYGLNYSIPTLRITDKTGTVGPLTIATYRTEGNGTIFYRTSSITAPTYNSTTADSVIMNDLLSDSQLVGNELLYTTGSVVENIAPPASDILFTYKNRVCLVPSENGSQIWYSKSVIPGTPIEFNDTFVINVPEQDGAIVTGGQLDDKMVIFKSNTIYIAYGDGPNNTGAQNDFGDPQIIATDVGCSSPKSVIQMPMGLMFKSAKGIYLLDRSLQVKYIGAEVEAYNQYPVTSVKKMEGVNQIRFSLGTVSTVLVFDYYSNQWSVFENIAAADSVMYATNYTYITSAGSVLTETPNLFLDNTTYIPLGFKTSWLSFAGLQGFQRVCNLLILGDYASPHTLKVEVAYDFEAPYTQTVNIPVLTAPTGRYQYRVQVSRQKCEAIQFNISETQTPTYGEGLSLSAFVLEVGAKTGSDRKGPGNTYG